MMAHDFRTKQKKTNEHPPVNDRRVVFRSSVGSSYLGCIPHARMAPTWAPSLPRPQRVWDPRQHWGPRTWAAALRPGFERTPRRLVGQGCHAEATPDSHHWSNGSNVALPGCWKEKQVYLTRQEIDSSGLWCCPHCVVDVFAGHRYGFGVSFFLVSKCLLLLLHAAHRLPCLPVVLLALAENAGLQPHAALFFQPLSFNKNLTFWAFKYSNSCREFIQGRTVRL